MPRYEYENYGILWRWKLSKNYPDSWQLYRNNQFPNQPMTFQRRPDAEAYIQNTEQCEYKVVIVEYKVSDEIVVNGIPKKVHLNLESE